MPFTLDMNRFLKNIMLLIYFMPCYFAQAQSFDLQFRILSADDRETLIGATVYIENLAKGAVSDANGMARFSGIPLGRHKVIVSYIGYKPIYDTLAVSDQSDRTYYLVPDEQELEELVVQASRSTRTVQKIPTRLELIGVEELSEKAIMNPTNISMVLRESTGIQMQQTSLSSGNTNIRIQGLDGRYTQLLRDGFPLYGGFSSGLSILQIPPLDLQQFEIIKGSSSTLYGGGAIAGLVNMVSKTPKEEAALDMMLTQTQASGSTANVYYSKRGGRWATSLYGSGHYQKVYDPEGDDFSNLPENRSIAFNPKVFYYPTDNSTFWLGLNTTYDERIGGDITTIEQGSVGIHQYTEDNTSTRISTQAAYTSQLSSEGILSVKGSFSFFDRQLKVPDFVFAGKQVNTFSEINYHKGKEKSEWIVGANLYSIDFDEDAAASLPRDQRYFTIGAFASNTQDLSERWVLEMGLRADGVLDWGFFLLPRWSLLYKSEKGFSGRLGGGLGYKVPDIFTEEAELINFENILPIDPSTLEAERSYGLNFDLDYQAQWTGEVGFTINQLFYLTAIDKALLLHTREEGTFSFANAPDNIQSKGMESNIKWSYKDFRWFLNYALIDTRLNYLPGNPQKPLTARHNAGSVIMYESERWRIGYETYYTGRQWLSNGMKTTDFVTMGLLLMHNLENISAFVNFENFTDRRQSRFSPLVLPPHENPDFPDIYAPTDGFIFSIGAIFKPFGREER